MSVAEGSSGMNKYNFLTYPPNHDDLIDESNRLCHNANVDLQNGGGYEEIVQFQHFLKDKFNLTVYSSRDGSSVYFKSPYTNKKVINLLLDENHYSVIKSLTGAFASAYFCAYCAEPYKQRHLHTKCVFRCERCFKQPPCEYAIEIYCDDCNRSFVNANCFQNHKDNRICLKVRICIHCLIRYKLDKKNPHICGTKYCKICKKLTPIRHECYIPPIEPKEIDEVKTLFIFYDFETTQNTLLHGNTQKFQHLVNLCISQQTCGQCMETEIQDNCMNCGERLKIFNKFDVIDSFMKYLGEIKDRFNNVVVIAHNMQKFDGHWIHVRA